MQYQGLFVREWPAIRSGSAGSALLMQSTERKHRKIERMHEIHAELRRMETMVDERKQARNLQIRGCGFLLDLRSPGNIDRIVQKTWILCVGWQSRAVKKFRSLCGRTK